MRLLLIVPSSTYRAPDFMDAAARAGVDVVVACDFDQAMATRIADGALTIDLDDRAKAVETIVARAERTPFDAIVAVDDAGAVIAADAARRLGLRSNPPDVVAATRDKAAIRSVLRASGLPQPPFAIVERTATSADVAGVAESVGFPCVVKPTSLSGSRGVIRADDPDGACSAFARAAAIAPADAHLVIERFVAGAEVAVEALVRGGRTTILAVFDKPDPLDGPFFPETIYVTPSRLPAEIVAGVETATSSAIAALGIVEGPVHAEVRFARFGPVVLEAAARSIGGLCSRTLRFGAGLTLEDLIIAHALGRDIATNRVEGAAGVMMIPVPTTGTLISVEGHDEAAAVADVDGVEITIPVGRRVEALPEGGRYLGFIFARGRTPRIVEQALRSAYAQLQIRIDRD